ncbi:hypothetical protein J3U57_05905 [Gilliamella sp. B3464]|uniref:ankyrin repeat domain-containing protein n=1 Tax=unclassified Gilliamella TaxID=2685620 RepID=UPI002269A1D1|nr:MULTISPECIES: ankyrin repeat domain-containing protein [unclassified Gilliamella]MCX8712354.1 hypothetical protein [Gilliamella sp. B3468]MCX8727043.1 hypothetical protein [Gilliamella sp. B2838]MCX8751100.1 hypothetical protein [Gilliamella sp. B3464]
MYNIPSIGNFETLPEVALAIYESDLEKMQALYQADWDINKSIHFNKYIDMVPIAIAVMTNQLPALKWLLAKQVSLDIGELTIIEMAAQHSKNKIVELLLEHNALDFLPIKNYGEIFERIQYGDKYEHIQLFEKYGVTIKKYGGAALRSSAFDGNMDKIKMWLEMGADINYHQPNMVFPYASTPLIEAVRANHNDIALYLIKNGCDVTITDKDGLRAYSVALRENNTQLMQVLKSLEPPQWHDEQEKIRQIKRYKIPADMLEYLKQPPKKIYFSGKDTHSKYITFYQLVDLQEIKWHRKNLLCFIEKVENYELYLVWSPIKKMICCLDLEHDMLTPMCSWQEFIGDPEKCINKLLDGEYDD